MSIILISYFYSVTIRDFIGNSISIVVKYQRLRIFSADLVKFEGVIADNNIMQYIL